MTFKDSAFFKTMRQRWKLANDAENAQSIREQEDIAFENGDQWPVDVQLARQGQQPINGMPAVPARPTLVIDKVKEPVRQVLNQERNADLGIEITTADDFGDLGMVPNDDEILLREGLVRRIQRESHAADARTWAYKRAVIAGRGYYIVRTRYLPGVTWDQEIYIDRIFNQDGVKVDPAHVQPDGSDAEWEFMGTWMPWDVFQAEYPKDAEGQKHQLADCTDQEWMALTESYPEWYKQDTDGEKGGRAVRIVDYWRTERERQDLALLPDGRVVPVAQVPSGVTPTDERSITTKTIHFSKVAGGLVELEKTVLPSPNMPIVKIVGEEVLPYDEQRRYKGMVRDARGAQMGFNYMVSKQVETVGLTPIPPLHVDPEAIDGYESWYAVANTRALPYLPSRTYDDQGRQLAPPTRPSIDPNILPIAQSIALFDQAIKSTTAVPDSTLGNVDPSLKSGRAIREVVQNAKLSTSNFLDNLTRSLRYEGKIVNDNLYPIYGSRPGRLVRVLTGTGEMQSMQIHGETPDPQMMQRASKVAKLTKDAHFNVIVKVSKSTEVRREQFVDMFSQILQADPQQMQVAGDLLYKNLDIPEARELAKRQRVMLAPPIQAMLQQEESGQPLDPQKMHAQMTQMHAQVQHLQQQLQEANSGTQAAQIKAQNDFRIAQMEDATKRYLGQLTVQATIQQTQAKIDADMAKASMDAETKKIAAVLDEKVGVMQHLTGMAHDAGQQAADHEHATTLQLLQQAHDRGMAAQQAVHQQDAQAQSQAGALQQQQQAAALQPPPSTSGAA